MGSFSVVGQQGGEVGVHECKRGIGLSHSIVIPRLANLAFSMRNIDP